VRRVEPAADGSLAVAIGPVDASGRPAGGPERRFEVDAVAVGNGLTASSDVTRLLRASHRFEADRGGWIPAVDADFRTSIGGLFAVGDGAGLAGAAAASVDGGLAGLAAARDLGALSPEMHARRAAPLRRASERARRFGGAMARLMALRPGQAGAIPADTIVCRCEDVTRAEIDAAIGEGATSVNQLKAWTRCGMGPCQGRICGDVVAALVAGDAGRREAAGFFTGRTPFRPLPLDRLVGTIDYADLKLPPPAPL
jgi:bacterioferritin-associated ferredoxin